MRVGGSNARCTRGAGKYRRRERLDKSRVPIIFTLQARDDAACRHKKWLLKMLGYKVQQKHIDSKDNRDHDSQDLRYRIIENEEHIREFASWEQQHIQNSVITRIKSMKTGLTSALGRN